jgi:ABC-type polysaccharide/polyol phosphate transport system ATPase subunit
MGSLADVMSVSVSVEHLSKKFRVFHERNRYLKTSLLRGRRARWEDFWALRDVSFEVHKGEAFGIVGHNGSGKSTMLKCLAGILVPDEGHLSVNGSMSALLELGAGFHADLSGRENIFLNGAILGMHRKELIRRFDEIVEFAGLEEFIDQPVRNYSTGMTVRLGFAVAINVEPDVLIIDEVLAVGDAEFQAKCRDKITEFRSAGKTIVLVTHGLADVLTLCDSALWLDHGLTRQLGDPSAIVDAYTGVAREGRKAEQAKGTRWGSGEARLVGLELLDESAQPVSFGRTGEALTFRLHYVAYQPLENVVFGIGVDHQNGQHITGTNTRRHGRPIPMIDGSGHVDYTIDHLTLLEGTYELSAAIADWTEAHDYDHWQHGLRFDVLPSTIHEEGYVSLSGQWRLEQAQPERSTRRVDAR